jgi:hypothetical protein
MPAGRVVGVREGKIVHELAAIDAVGLTSHRWRHLNAREMPAGAGLDGAEIFIGRRTPLLIT